jgi:repressor LexA
MKTLSPRQQKILAFIRRFIDGKEYPPSIRDIQVGCGISSTSVVDYNLKALERMGQIRRDREVSRAIELLDGSGRRVRSVAVPLVGRIAAGEPIPVPEGSVAYDETVSLTPDMTGGRENVFALRVKGTSMIDELINDGDIVVMEQTDTAQDGDTVAVWLKKEQEVTLKKLYREGDRVRLQPANEALPPIYADASNVEIQGRVLSLFRPVS